MPPREGDADEREDELRDAPPTLLRLLRLPPVLLLRTLVLLRRLYVEFELRLSVRDELLPTLSRFLPVELFLCTPVVDEPRSFLLLPTCAPGFLPAPTEADAIGLRPVPPRLFNDTEGTRE